MRPRQALSALMLITGCSTGRTGSGHDAASSAAPPAPDAEPAAAGEASTPLADSAAPDAAVVCGESGGFTRLFGLPAPETCTRIEGTLGIDDWAAARLPLDRLEHVTGDLSIFRPRGLSSLAGLDALRSVEGELRLFMDDGALTSLAGLGKLEEVGSLVIDSMHALTSLAGLQALVRIRGDFVIRDNPMLPMSEIDALRARVEVGGTLMLSGNAP